MNGYYDPYPRLLLDEPLVLVGHPGSGVSLVGHALCARTGLAFNDVERSTEATAGRSRARVLFEEGAEALFEREGRALRQALSRSPLGVAVVGSACLASVDPDGELLQVARWMFVQRPLEILLARIGRQLEGAPASLPEYLPHPPKTAEDLAQRLAPWERGLESAHAILEAGDRHPQALADEIESSLDRLVGARPC